MRMSPAELVAHHAAVIEVKGTAVTLTFRDQRLARAFHDSLVDEARELPAGRADRPERLRAEQLDDLLASGSIERRLFDIESSIRIQRRRINTLMATYVERAHLPNGRFPSYCCQRFGDQIGWVGRFFQAAGLRLHTCRIRRADEVDLATAEAVRTKVEAA